MVGLGIYYLERNIETGESKYLEKITDYLFSMKPEIAEHPTWVRSGYGKYPNDHYNFGMAHGIPGILSFLSQVYNRGIRQSEIEEMIISSISFILQNEYKESSAFSYPTIIDVKQNEIKQPYSRLAWCYGDLCISNALIHCGKTLQNKSWQKKGIEIALKTTLRTTENSGCIDSSFCHGTIGLVHQYNRLYKCTNNEYFRLAAETWLQITQQLYYKPGKGAGGYFYKEFDVNNENFEPVVDYSLLQGSAGIALVYLSYITAVPPDWDIIFLTNV